MLTEHAHPTQGLLGLGEGGACSDGLRLRFGRFDGQLDVHGLDLALGVEERHQLGPATRLHQGEHLPGFHACPEDGREAPGGEEPPCDMGHRGFVARAYGHHARQAQPLGHRRCCTGSVLRQDFPLLFFEKRDAFRLWWLWGLPRLLV